MPQNQIKSQFNITDTNTQNSAGGNYVILL